MARWDEVGIFWEDIRVERVAKVKVRPTPPEPVWLEPGYLPNLEEARAYQFDLMTDAEILAAAAAREPLVWDMELYPNYTLVGFMSVVSGKLIMFEMRRGETLFLDKLRWVLTNFLIVGFNSIDFDAPLAAAALTGADTQKLYDYVELIIHGLTGFGLRAYEFYRQTKVPALTLNHVDLIELTPLSPSLKVTAGRLHAPKMQDLPFAPGTELSDDQITILRWYWVNDVQNTRLLWEYHKPAIELREILSAEYGVDVRSKSDPQIAEAVIRAEYKRITGKAYYGKADIQPGRRFFYQPPAYLRYATPLMQWVLDFVCKQPFTIDERGGPRMSKELSDLIVPIGTSQYQMGVGGLHSREKCTEHVSDEDWELTDNDVTSYYPSLIIQQGMYPPNVGPVFQQIFRRIYDRRIAAKREGVKSTAETLKIVLNGTFGKTGERGGFSIVYYPEMMVQVTVTGQLSLLMLIERLELAGIPVVSANTDGIVIKCPRALLETKAAIIAQWERDTGLGMESTPYKAIYSRDVNTYIAFYAKPKGDDLAKTKGGFSYVKDSVLKVNPTTEVCIDAVVRYLGRGDPIEHTIRDCTDIRRFVAVRNVKGGAVKDGEYLGKAIRWYYAKGEEGVIVTARQGHSVPLSKGARPCMTLPQGIPADLDFDWYIQRAYSMLEDLSEPEAPAEEKAA